MTKLTERERAIVEMGCQWIDEHNAALVDLLGDLTARPSLPGDEGTHNDQESTVGQLWSFLNTHCDGAEIYAQPLPPKGDHRDDGRENVYTVLTGDNDGGFVATSHTDVVPPGPRDDWPNGDPWTMHEGSVRHVDDRTVEVAVGGYTEERTIREKLDRVWKLRDIDKTDALFGRGVYDNKASIVCLAGSLLGLDAAIADSDATLAGDIVHGHLVDEEHSQIGAKNMVGWGNAADWFGNRYCNHREFTAIVLEGSYGFVPVVGHRGLVWVTLRAEGKSAHASTPKLGRNAVLGLSKALAENNGDVYNDVIAEPFVDDSLLGGLTVAPGTTIVGGGIQRVDHESGKVERDSVNTIPDWCEATFDVRVPRWHGYPNNIEKLQDQLCTAIEESAVAATHEIEFSASVGNHGFFPPVALADNRNAAANHPLVTTAAWAAEDTFGYEPGLDVAPGVTDAAFIYHGTRIPTLAEYGPAGALSHECLEYVERDQVIEGAKAMLKVAVAEVGLAGE